MTGFRLGLLLGGSALAIIGATLLLLGWLVAKAECQ